MVRQAGMDLAIFIRMAHESRRVAAEKAETRLRQPKKLLDAEKGGKGGNGGGGGGSAGRGSSWQRWPNKGYTVSQANLSASSGGSNGGGKGSDGGQGDDGCIIIYYRKKKELQSGPLVTSNNYGLLDSPGGE